MKTERAVHLVIVFGLVGVVSFFFSIVGGAAAFDRLDDAKEM